MLWPLSGVHLLSLDSIQNTIVVICRRDQAACSSTGNIKGVSADRAHVYGNMRLASKHAEGRHVLHRLLHVLPAVPAVVCMTGTCTFLLVHLPSYTDGKACHLRKITGGL
jgi:hypothetical protein